MTTQVHKEGKRTLVIEDRRVDFDQDIVETVVIDGRVIVLLNPSDFRDDDPDSGRNVFAYDNNGELLWRIEDAEFRALGKGGRRVPQGYTGIWIEDGQLKAFQPIGCDCTIDVETGKITAEEQTK